VLRASQLRLRPRLKLKLRLSRKQIAAAATNADRILMAVVALPANFQGLKTNHQRDGRKRIAVASCQLPRFMCAFCPLSKTHFYRERDRESERERERFEERGRERKRGRA